MPFAVTVKLAVEPAQTVWFVGLAVMLGAVFTTRVAAEEVRGQEPVKTLTV